MDELVAGCVVNPTKVDPETERLTLIALERMLANIPPGPVAIK